ncbi:BgTH12-04514 [Blumeria graminis f. sp. triticale]|uniref:Bgt-4133 n=3 Tax=Blumeria graminis TaxID=34373 RepID=A0A061HJW3_BLUGR|nr:hypothetical protein BGT96224_4133 [Blumeria graminis f. sp. tritici 96224]CAD6498856.1 BgTH12-04514 [Blumeria graminis f. sp. triticale]VCU38964.1 Bgt-4133 [Blumeria graminis f. sp. tritici]
MPKAITPSSTSAKHGRRHNPLEADLTASVSQKIRLSKRVSQYQDEGDSFIDSKASRRILQMGQQLVDEDIDETPEILKSTFNFEERSTDDDEESEEPLDQFEEWGVDEEEEELEVADIDTFNKFFPEDEDVLLKQGWGAESIDNNKDTGTNLADIILQKIAAHEAAQANTGRSHNITMKSCNNADEIPEKVIEVYTKVGLILSRYKSGKLPKPFKILPTIPRWEEILEITRPDKWTANACYEATKIFISSKPATAQQFMETVILERVREEIHETKKLNVHLFNALKKGLYKPAAWFKGFLFPLIGSGTCTLREAHIVSAVLVRVSVPVLHSAAALKGLCDIAAQETSTGTEGGGATNVFIKALLEKKYALPYQVIDALVFHFLRFKVPTLNNAAETEGGKGEYGAVGAKDSRLPIIWHQCLLAFAQRYRNDITEDQREALLDLLLTKGHYKIGPEIRRELLDGRGRGVALEVDVNAIDGDDTMMLE